MRLYSSVIDGPRGAVVPQLLLDAAYARQSLGDLDSALTLAARAIRLDSTLAPAVERNIWYDEMRRLPAFPDAMKGIAPSEVKQR